MADLVKKDEYYDDFSKIIEMIETRRNNVYRKVNDKLMALYWDVGKFVAIK